MIDNFKLILTNKLIKKDIANYTKIGVIVSFITMTTIIITLIIAIV